MTSMQLFESLQYLDDTLLPEEDPQPAERTKWRLTWAVAACLVLAVVLPAFVRVPRTGEERGSDLPHLDLPTAGQAQGAGGEVYWTQPQPGGVPGQETYVPAPGPAVLAWNEIDADAAGGPEADVAGVVQVAEPLTAAQLALCAPEIRESWMEDFDGAAVYYLKDGAGGLAFIEMTARSAARDGKCTIRLRDAAAPEMVDCFVRPQPETDKVGSYNGQEYRAYRMRYDRGAGDAAEPWIEMRVIFQKENVIYTLLTDAPEAQADRAAADLRDLLLCYVGTHAAPDLGAFQYGEYLLRDETLTLAEALSDPDFGAYLPAAGPEGFGFDFARRYQFEETVDYLMAFWMYGRADLHWLIQPVSEEAKSRIVSPEERERYDWNAYPVPWSAYAAQENWATIENPVFRIGELTPELVSARAHDGDEGMTMFRFGVLYDSGVLVEVNAKGVSEEWVYETLMQLG